MSVESLLRERAGYVARNLPDRVAQVDAVLRSLGHEVEQAVAPSSGIEAAVRRPGRPRKEG